MKTKLNKKIEKLNEMEAKEKLKNIISIIEKNIDNDAIGLKIKIIQEIAEK